MQLTADRRQLRVNAVVAGTILLLGAAIGLLRLHPGGTMVLALLPWLLLGIAEPRALAALSLALLPYSHSVLSGTAQLTPADALLVIAAATVVVQSVGSGATSRISDGIRPLLPLLLLYGTSMLISLGTHPASSGALEVLQRTQLVVVPLLVGAAARELDWTRRSLTSFTVGMAFFSAVDFAAYHVNRQLLDLVFPLINQQKNPTGQFVATGVLIVLSGMTSRIVTVTALPLLCLGLGITGSRGALVGLAAGVVVLTAMTSGRQRIRTTIGLVLLTGLMAMVVLRFLPSFQRDRLLDFSGRNEQLRGTLTQSQYALALRTSYSRDAKQVIRAHPLTGVGLAQYKAGFGPTYTTNPHNVFLAEAAEGGLGHAAAFTLLVGGSLVVVVRRRRQDPRLAALAVAVQTSVLVHSLTDIYWVRGTPEIGWFLVGLALARTEARAPAAA